MKRFLLFIFTLLQSQALHAAIRAEFKRPDGSTNWQHVANWSASILILLLTAAVITLFFTWRQARKANRELQTIRNDLELRVQERTATLGESNRLLKQSNQLLEHEIAQHVSTTARLRSSESYIRDILKSMPLMLIGLDKEGRITQWNKRSEDATGIKAENVLGKNLWDAYPTITVSPSQISEAIQKNDATTIKHSQRGQYYYDITIYPLQEQSEPGVVILIDDVTKKILAENMLIQSDKMSSVGELAATMAHDINAPLQSILFDLRTFQHLLADSSQNLNELGNARTSETLKGLLADATEKGENMASIVHNLQDFARGRSNRKQLSNIVDIVEHTLELAGDVLSVPSRLRFKDIQIERIYQKDLPMTPCYVAELQHVLLSLFRHACDALGRVERPGHTPTIKIQMNVGYDNLWIRIEHNGLGLSNEEQMYLFEPFFRKDSPEVKYDASKRLSFAYFIITEQHQGQMAVTSDLNVGTTFHIQMPLK
ncbi:MAG: PAS domain-containing sensor histidine kinase [Gammaproteobacteria bacterium RBG_16_57_12]|nr:MAG: PAS domain-containing sensor histidine kinase [Gammaproteobacteria bacterium RBG_16_57_12]